MVDHQQTARIGINAVEKCFLQMGWIFREQPIADYGVDAHVEIKTGGLATGQLIALQIKSGSSYFRKGGKDFIRFSGEKRHLDYWEHHSLPVFLILHDPKQEIALWQRIERRLIKSGKDGGWSIRVPRENILNSEAKRFLSNGIASDDEAGRRFRISLDIPLMEQIAERSHAHMVIEEWLNKPGRPRFRNIEFRFGEYQPEPDIRQEYGYPLDTVHELMVRWFPWLTYTYEEPVRRYGEEGAHHRLYVEVNELGKAYLALQKYFRKGLEDEPIPTPPEDEEELTEDELMEEDYQKAIEKD